MVGGSCSTAANLCPALCSMFWWVLWHLCSIPITSASGIPDHPMGAEVQAACGAVLLPSKFLAPTTLTGDTSQIHWALACTMSTSLPWLCLGRQVTSQSPQRPHTPPLPHFPPSLQTSTEGKCEATENQACPCQPGNISPPPQPLDSQTTDCLALGSPVSHRSWLPTPPVQDLEQPKFQG